MPARWSESDLLQNSPETSAGGPTGWLAPLLDFLRSFVQVARWQLAAVIFLMTITSLTEGLGVALLFPILQVAGFNLTHQGHVGHYTAEVQALLVRTRLPVSSWLAALLALFVLLMALRSLFSRVQSVLTFSTVVKYELAVSRSLYEAVIHAEWLYLVRRRSSDFAHALTGELARLSAGAYLLIGALSNAILSLVYIAIALKLSARMTMLVLGGGILLLVLSRRWMRAVHRSGAAVSNRMSEVYAAASEHLQNLKAMKAYGAQTGDLEMVASLQSSAREQSLHNMRSQAGAAFWFEAGSLLALGSVIFASLKLLRVEPASILLLLAVFTRLMPRLAAGNNQLQGFLTELPAFERIVQLRRECIAHAELPSDSAPAPLLRRELRLEEVSFRYLPEQPLVVDRVSMVLALGKITAVTGASGAGKSTIADLVNGLLTPESGRILIDGTQLMQQSAWSWRQQVGYVGQDTVLFHDSIRSNLLWAQPGASEQEMRQALTLAAAEFVFTLPLGLDTTVGDRGVLLSNGQRQRIGLARALLRRPALLILDEATNSLDLENEGRILQAVEDLKQTAAIFMIAHRPSTIACADVVYALEQGRLAEPGTRMAMSGRAN